MSSVLAEIQAGYEQRAQQAAQAPVSPPGPLQYRFATRTYTGAPLARRQAWGREWGGILKARAQAKRIEGH